MEAYITAAWPLLELVLYTAITIAAGFAARKWGIDVEEKHRNALHSALMTGARLALNRQLTGPAAIDLIVTHVRQSVPDALGKLKPSENILGRLAEAKLQEAGDKLARELNRAIGR